MSREYFTGLKNPKCIDLTGQKFGKLTAIIIDPTRRKRVFWVCKCDCGEQKSVAAKHLRKGAVKSCGCDRRRTNQNHPSWKGYQEISGKHWAQIQRHAALRSRKFAVGLPYLWNLFLQQKRCCALTGQPLGFQSRSDSTDGNASLDRIDSSKGYVKGNVWWVDKDVNAMKSDFSLDFFRRTCKMVAEYEFTT